MNTARLTVISILKRNYFLPEITVKDFPEGVIGTIEHSFDWLDEHMTGSVLLITDNANLVRAFVNRSLKDSYAVYIGDPLDIGAAFDLVTDVWSPFDGGMLLKKRYLLLLEYIRCRTECNEFKGSIQNYQP